MTGATGRDRLEAIGKLNRRTNGIETRRTKCTSWKRLAERYLNSGPEEIQVMLEYALKQQTTIEIQEIKESNEPAEMNLKEKVINLEENDKLLYNKLNHRRTGIPNLY